MKLSPFLAKMAIGVASLAFPGNVWAGELVHGFVNPSFGGSSLNATYLMQQAESQNTFTDPNASSADSVFNRDPLDNFKESLERQILSVLAQRILNEAFGSDGLSNGGNYSTDEFGIQVFTDNPDVLNVQILDKNTNQITVIELPRM